MSLPQNLPSTLHDKFTAEYNGHVAAIFHSLGEANNVAIMLRKAEISFIQKVRKRKKRATQFVVMLVPSS